MKYLVTGGAGFLGAALVRRLVLEGHEVRVLDDLSRGKAARLDTTCEIVEGDIRDTDVVVNALHGCDSVVHMAYLQGTNTFYVHPKTVLDVATRGMLNVLTACERTGTGDLLLISSSEVYQTAAVVPTPETIPLTVPDPLNARYSYGGGKILCELMTLAWQREGILDRVIIARPHNVYGPDSGREHVIPEFCIRMNTLTRNIPAGVISFPIQGSGMETRSFCYIKDCIDQLSLLLDKVPSGPHIYHVGTQDEFTISEVAYGVAECYGREIKILPGTLPKGSPPRRLPDTTKIETLGWQASQRTSFATGVSETVDWYRKHG
jgi:dTDP-glucose 4,6-dehydratase/UDP-glucose 4-epimerase